MKKLLALSTLTLSALLWALPENTPKNTQRSNNHRQPEQTHNVAPRPIHLSQEFVHNLQGNFNGRMGQAAAEQETQRNRTRNTSLVHTMANFTITGNNQPLSSEAAPTNTRVLLTPRPAPLSTSRHFATGPSDSAHRDNNSTQNGH